MIRRVNEDSFKVGPFLVWYFRMNLKWGRPSFHWGYASIWLWWWEVSIEW